MKPEVEQKIEIISKEIINVLFTLKNKKQRAEIDVIKTLVKQNNQLIKVLFPEEFERAPEPEETESQSKIDQLTRQIEQFQKDYDFVKKQMGELQKLNQAREKSMKNLTSALIPLEELKGYSWHQKIVDLKKSRQFDQTVNNFFIQGLINDIRNESFKGSIDKEETDKESKRTFLSKLFEKEKKEFDLEKLKETLYQKIQHIVSEIDIKGYQKLNDRCQKFLNKFLKKFSLNKIADYLEDIIELIQELKYQSQIKRDEIDQFLKDIIERLIKTEQEFFESFITDTAKNRSANEEFHSDLSNQLDSIGTSFKEFKKEDNLDTFKSQIIGSLDSIKKKVEEKNKAEKEQFEKLKAEIQELKKQLAKEHQELERVKEESKKIEHEMLLDGLTGIYNRKALDERFEEVIKLHRRYNTKYSLILIDIDHFKHINDTYGHRVGDNAIIKIVNNIKSVVREVDFFGRYGGEEFALILYDTTIDQAKIVAEKVRKLIESIIFTYKKSKTIKITISLGVSNIKSTDSIDSFIVRADKALYHAKNNGRNTVKTELDLAE